MIRRIAIILPFLLILTSRLWADSLDDFLDVDSTIQYLQSQQNKEGWFGKSDWIFGNSRALEDTYYTIGALVLLEAKPTNSARCIRWLQSIQKADGSFWDGNIESAYRSLATLKLLESKPKEAKKCLLWILAQEKEGGYFGTILDTAYAVLALDLLGHKPPHPEKTAEILTRILYSSTRAGESWSFAAREENEQLWTKYWAIQSLEILGYQPSRPLIKKSFAKGWRYGDDLIMTYISRKYQIEPPNIEQRLMKLRERTIRPLEYGEFSSSEDKKRFLEDLQRKTSIKRLDPRGTYFLVQASQDYLWLKNHPAGFSGEAIRVGYSAKSTLLWVGRNLPYCIFWLPGLIVINLAMECHILPQNYTPNWYGLLFMVHFFSIFLYGGFAILMGRILKDENHWIASVFQWLAIFTFISLGANFMGIPVGVPSAPVMGHGFPSAPVGPGIPQMPMPGPEFGPGG